MIVIIALFAVGFYVFATYKQYLNLNQEHANRSFVLILVMLGALLHLAYLGNQLFLEHRFNVGLPSISVLISWTVVVLLIFSSWKKPVENLFIGTLPIAAFTLIASLVLSPSKQMMQVEYGLAWHILLSILAYSVFMIAIVQAILLLIQERRVKKPRSKGIIKSLPPLQSMDELLFEMIWLGTLILTMALLLGLPYVTDLIGQHLLHKVIFSSIGWLIFIVLLFGRYRYGWCNATAAKWTLAGGVLLTLSYVGSKFVLEFLLA